MQIFPLPSIIVLTILQARGDGFTARSRPEAASWATSTLVPPSKPRTARICRRRGLDRVYAARNDCAGAAKRTILSTDHQQHKHHGEGFRAHILREGGKEEAIVHDGAKDESRRQQAANRSTFERRRQEAASWSTSTLVPPQTPRTARRCQRIFAARSDCQENETYEAAAKYTIPSTDHQQYKHYTSTLFTQPRRKYVARSGTDAAGATCARNFGLWTRFLLPAMFTARCTAFVRRRPWTTWKSPAIASSMYACKCLPQQFCSCHQ